MGNRELRIAAWITAAALCFAAACSDGSGNLKRFDDSGCKKETALSSGTYALSNASYDGLQCIQWKTTAETAMTVTCINFANACGPTWKGDAVFEPPSTLRLTVDNPGCMIAACGSCIYDWTFEVDKVEPEKDLKLAIEANYCPGKEKPDTWSFTIPSARLASGIVCRNQDPGVLAWDGECGSLHGVCRTESSGICSDGGAPCDSDLLCGADAGAGDAICHKPCIKDSDCPLDGLLTCQGSLCLLKETW